MTKWLRLRILSRGGFAPRDITIVSCHGVDSGKSILRKLSALPELRGKLQILTPELPQVQEKILMTSVFQYKGLQATVVILVDVDPSIREPNSYLVYSGMSRAKFMLFVFTERSVAQHYRL